MRYCKWALISILSGMVFFAGCGEGGSDGGDGGGDGGGVYVEFLSVVETGGATGSVNSTGLILTFDVEPTTLTADNITVVGAIKGELSGNGTSKTLGLISIDVADGETVSVSIDDPSGYSISGSPRTAVVYRALVIPCVSCDGLPNTCGSSGDMNCCTSTSVAGGSFSMGRSISGDDACPSGMTCYADEQPEHTANIGSFKLDAFEVTVGRFRKFVEEGMGTQSNPPEAGSGAHPLIANSGWQFLWVANLAADKAALISSIKCHATYQTWTDAPGANENKPINCIDWYTAFAFCIWDGGRLPTEAEWEYAAAGGSENRLYPWGSATPDDTYVNTSIINVGSKSAGISRYGQYDMAGSLYEWNFDFYSPDWYSGGGAACHNCANGTTGSNRVIRGGSCFTDNSSLRAASRAYHSPTNRYFTNGFRCARD